MVNSGVVTRVNGHNITVHLYKESACAHCSKCGDKEKMASLFEFRCQQEVEAGDTITFEIEDNSVLSIAALVYIVPIFFMIGGYYLSSTLGFSEGLSILTSFLGLILSFLGIHLYDKKKGDKVINESIKITNIEKPKKEA